MARTITPRASAKAAPTVARMADGRVVLTNLPFMVPGIGADGASGRASRLMGAKGLGWTWDSTIKGWATDVRGAARIAVDTLADHGVEVIDLSGKGAAPVAPVATKGAAAINGRPKAPTVKAEGADSALAAKITAALARDGIAPEIIAAAIMAATAKADEMAKAATASVSARGRARATAAKGATAKRSVTPPAGIDQVSTDRDGSRRYMLLRSVSLGAAAKAARQALPRAGRMHVKKDRTDRALIVYREDGATVSDDIDQVIVGAVASVL